MSTEIKWGDILQSWGTVKGASSEEALLLQAQTAVLAGKASSASTVAAIFSGLNFLRR